MAEQRAHTRYRIRLGAEIRAGDTVVRGATVDVSRGGCRFESSVPLSEGVSVTVRLRVVVDDVRDPDYPPLETRATVRWTAPTEADPPSHYSGLEFHDISEAQGTWIQNIISRDPASI